MHINFYDIQKNKTFLLIPKDRFPLERSIKFHTKQQIDKTKTIDFTSLAL